MSKTLAKPLTRRTIAIAGGSIFALAAKPMLAHDATPDATTTTTAATPDASPVPASVPAPTTAEVLPAYRELADSIRSQGQAVVNALLNGDSTPLEKALSATARASLSATDLAGAVAGLQANQLRFSFGEVGAHWFGTVDTGIIAGFFQQNGVRDTFSLTPRDGGASPAASPAVEATPSVEALPFPTGIWTGSLDTLKLPFEIAFSGSETEPSATITITDQGITGVTLGDVSFQQDAPFGALSLERAIPLAPANHIYSQVRAWGGAQIRLDLTLADDEITSITLQPTIILPEDPAAGYTSSVTYQLPWEQGAWWVFWGGDTEFQNYHTIAPGQRHAYDIVIWKDGSTFDGDGATADQYWIWGQPLLAPAAGTVVEALNDQPDQVPGATLAETDPAAFKTLHPAGNHIVLQTSEQEFVYLAHMQHGSVRVQKGDILRAGDPVGLVGNSGNTSEPHLHIHVQNVADFYDPKAVGLPLVFSDLTVDGKSSPGGELLQGSFVEPKTA